VEDQPLELVGEPVFDFPQQALIYLPRLRAYDWQDREGYFEAVAGEAYRLLDVSRGRAFCLFTSWAGMQYVSEKLRDQLPWPVLIQGELPRAKLLRLFKSTPHSVLFGTKSFWEGVDIPGDALSLVIIDKLPFPSPRDPLHESRANHITEEGGNAFMEYSLPLMILALKQGFGRLIRTKTDRGVVALLDNRLTTKRYGNLVLGSLPPATVARRFADVHRFFSVAPLDADYAVTAWVADADDDTSSYRWQLARLSDGRTREGTGQAPGQGAAWWAAVLAAATHLRDAIQKGGRQAAEFRIEIRLPGVGGSGQQILQAAPPDLRSRLDEFAAAHLVALDGDAIT
jgi:ATP-dependent DNA helicase DinG